MITEESNIWDTINNSKKTKPSAEWLKNAYNPNISFELRQAITIHLGQLSQVGWVKIKDLIKTYGNKDELILAAGLTNQDDAKQWLLKNLYNNEEMNIKVVEALACWGGTLPIELIKKILEEKSEKMRIAGLELLKFKAHLLSDFELLDIAKSPLNDFRENIVIKTLTIIQKRESLDICNAISDIIKKGSDKSAYFGLMALGSIGSEVSKNTLLDLAKNLKHSQRKELAKKQLNLEI
tara:strand:+ start:394 stop:1104 length:711 start_codon:yes stop_codon:yes gene_type:complete